MSLITRCPACATMFKVVPDQLRISDGWVRCGQCAEVFDAAGHMQQAEPLAAAGPAVAAGVQEPAVMGSSAELVEANDAAAASSGAMLAGKPGNGSPWQAGPGVDDLPEPEPEPVPEGTPQTPSLDPLLHAGPSVDLLAGEAVTDLPFPGDPADEVSPDVSFVRDARRRLFWSRPWVRVALWSGCVLATLTLVLQFVWREHDRLAAAVPETRAGLEIFCAYAGCRLAAPRQMESLVIDGSSFGKTRANLYRLNATLRNSAPYGIATPFLELSLTDTQDQAVIRKVLSPAEFNLSASSSLPGGGERSVSMTLMLSGDGPTGRIAGYRLLAFYP